MARKKTHVTLEEIIPIMQDKIINNKPKVGRPRLFEKAEDLEQAWNLYKKEVKANEREWLDKTGFCEWIGCYPDVISNCAKLKEFYGIVKVIDEDCKRDLLKRGLFNEYNASIVKLIACSDYGMAEKTDNKNDNVNNNFNAELSPTELREEIRKARIEKNGKL